MESVLMSEVGTTSSITRSAVSAPATSIVRAILLGERIDTRGLDDPRPLATAPLALRCEPSGIAVVFRYGVAVLFQVSPSEERRLIDRLMTRVVEPYEPPEVDELRVAIRPDAEEQIGVDGTLTLRDLAVERAQVVADALAKSLVLAHYETRIASIFDRIEPLAASLRRRGRPGSQGRFLLRHIGNVLSVQHKMVGRVETGEKPEVLWDHPALERLYMRLADEYELPERDRALDRKLEVISRTVETLLDLVTQSRNLRVEWYIVGLIVIELVLSVYFSIFK
jgi:required for meiotic nuclear division protein 1